MEEVGVSHLWNGPLVSLGYGEVVSCSLCAADASDDYLCGPTEYMALTLYKEDGFQPAIYATAEEGWRNDRADVRNRYRAKAHAMIENNRS